MESRHPLDHLIATADRALRAVFAPAHASRPVPSAPPAADASPIKGTSPGAPPVTGAPPANSASAVAGASSPNAGASSGATAAMSEAERRESAALMRVNHAGEIAAQALYHGQAFVSQSAATRNLLLKAATEENDHLAWCETRLNELGSRPSLLNPLWYCGSFAIGVIAAVSGDRTSLGFVVETEKQVEGHLDEHLTRLPSGDTRSRAILTAMRADEIEHGATAKAAGAAELPTPVRALMRQVARVMTTTAYWI